MARYFTAANSEYLDGGATGTTLKSVPRTMHAWVYSVSSVATQSIFCTELVGTNSGHGILLVSGNAWAFSQSTSSFSNAAQAYTANAWQSVTGVWRAANDRSIWLNGTENNDTTSISPSTSGTWDVIIGKRVNTAQYFDGRIAEVAYWDVALTDEEAQALADGVCPLLVRPESLVSYSPFGGRWTKDDADLDIMYGPIPWSPVNTPTTAEHPRIIYPQHPQIWLPGPLIFSGTGGLTLTAATSSSTGKQEFKATSAIDTPATSVSSSGKQTFTSTASLTTSTVQASATGGLSFTATAALSVGPATLSSTGKLGFAATSSIALPSPSPSSLGKEEFIATASISVSSPEIDGTGAVEVDADVIGTGSLTTATVVVSGTGKLTFTGTSTLEIPSVTISALGYRASIFGVCVHALGTFVPGASSVDVFQPGSLRAGTFTSDTSTKDTFSTVEQTDTFVPGAFKQGRC